MARASKRQFFVTITPTAGGPAISDYFATKSGGATQAQLSKVFDGGNPNPFVLPGVAETQDLTVTRPYDWDRDASIISQLRNGPNNASWIGRYAAQITVQPTDANFVAQGTPEHYTGLLSAVTPSDVDSSSGEPAIFSLTFVIATAT